MYMQQSFNSVFDYSSAFKYGSADMITNKKSVYKTAFTYHSVYIQPEDDRGKYSDETFTFVVLRKFIIVLLYLLVIISFPISFWICLKRVHALERIVLMRLGKLEPVRGPGFAFILPFVDKWTKVDLRSHNFSVSSRKVLTADGGIVEIQTDVEYRVSDVLSYVLKLHQQEQALRELGSCCLTNVISEKDQEDLEMKPELISRQIKDELNKSAVNWGLEIMNVYLHSLNILKNAEPTNAIGSIMTALKAVSGNSLQHTAAMFPFISNVKEETSVDEVGNKCVDVSNNTKDCVEVIQDLAAFIENANLMTNIDAKFLFDIVGTSNRLVHIHFKKGNISVVEVADKSLKSDIQLTLSEDSLRDFLKGTLSPMQAYVDGQVIAKGDRSLLRHLTQVFEISQSFNAV